MSVWRRLKGLHGVSQAFIILVLIELIIIEVAAGLYLNDLNHSADNGHDPISLNSKKFYSYLVLFTPWILLYLSLDAVLNENAYELISFMCMSMLLFIRVVLNFVITSEDLKLLVLGPIVIAGGFQLIYFVLGWAVFKTFGWLIFTRVGTHPDKIARFKTYQAFLSVLKVDMTFSVSLGMFTYFINYKESSKILLIFLSAFSILFALCTMAAVKRGMKWFLGLFTFWLCFLPPYLIYKMEELVRNDKEELHQITPTERTNTLSSLLIACILAVICRIFLVYLSFMLFRRFPDKSETLSQLSDSNISPLLVTPMAMSSSNNSGFQYDRPSGNAMMFGGASAQMSPMVLMGNSSQYPRGGYV